MQGMLTKRMLPTCGICKNKSRQQERFCTLLTPDWTVIQHNVSLERLFQEKSRLLNQDAALFSLYRAADLLKQKNAVFI